MVNILQVSGNFNSDTDRAALLAAVPVVAPQVDMITEIQAKQWLRIKAKRDLLISSGGYKVVVGGLDKWFHSDTFSRSQQLGLVLLGANVPAIPWKTMDGTFVTLAPAIVQQIFSACATSDAAIFAVAEAHKTNMLASADPAGYNIATGWPVTFLG